MAIIDENSLVIPISGVENFRELGKYPATSGKIVKSGLLYRSAKLSKLDSNGSKTFNELGIRTIVDFRGETTPTPFGNINLIHIPISYGEINDHFSLISKDEFTIQHAKDFMCSMYRSLVTDCYTQYRKFFQQLLDEQNYPIVFHCTAGKDRTGFAAAILLSLLGVEQEQIVANYLKTNELLLSFKSDKRLALLPENTREKVRILLSADELYLSAAFDTISRQYGNISSYFKEGLGIDDEQQEQLKHLLLH